MSPRQAAFRNKNNNNDNNHDSAAHSPFGTRSSSPRQSTFTAFPSTVSSVSSDPSSNVPTATSSNTSASELSGGSGAHTISHRGPHLSQRPPVSPPTDPAYGDTEKGLKYREPVMGAFSLPIPFTRRFVILGIIIVTVIITLTSRSDIVSSSLSSTPSSWFPSSSSISTMDEQKLKDAGMSVSLSALSTTERKLVVAQAENKAKLAPYFNPNPSWGGREHGRDDYKAYTDRKLRELAVCVATNTCRENQTSVIIYGHIFSHFHIYEGYMGGEGIWTASLTETLEKYGYTILHARDDWPYMWYIHNQIPDMVKAIIAWKSGQYGGFADFVKSGWRQNGVPAWKFFVYNYFPDHYNSMVGDAWNIHSEFGYSNKQRNFTLLPYIVDMPPSPPYIPTEERPPQIYILAKFVRYFYPGTQPAWEDHTFYSRAKAELEIDFPGFEFVVGCRDDRNGAEQEAHPMSVPEGIRNLGQMDKTEFERQLANSRGMLGIGWPTLSPSPHVALSYGIPFISPYGMYGWSSPDKPETWSQSQHDTLKALGEPYVYHVLRNDYKQFVSAIRKALSTPIPQFRLPYVTREYQEKAVEDFLATDWKAKAIEILENRKKGIETENGNVIQEFAV
ncbi:hypothetical protein IAR55_004128 [Kwoniella newhampshirensis]|uniref:Glycosyltransferase family 18 catalytic domain-containing protein n=1 Tax=Kwoniella newhampshirensis TaxID=1651941 RepID=A0AAW0YLL5_9TREE